MGLATSARMAALGGVAFGGVWRDPAAAFRNPAYLRAQDHQRVALTYQPYLADIANLSVAYVHDWMGIGTFWSGLQYLHYGQIRHTDELGNALGTFSAYEGVWALGAVRHFGRWHVGMNLKTPFSVVSLERYRRLGLAADIAACYEDSAQGLAIAVVLWSVGAELVSPKGRAFGQPFPTQIQMTVSYKLPHAPFRLHLGAIHLERWRLAANDPLQPVRYDLSGNPIPPPPPRWTEHLFRHLVGGIEAEFSPSFVARLSYHVQRRRELNPSGSASLGGLSFGAGLNLRRWGFDYAYSLYFRQAGAHSLSLWIRPFLRKNGQ